MNCEVREGSESAGQTAGMIGKVRGKVKIDGPNSGNDRESWEKVKIDGPNSENDSNTSMEARASN